MYLAEIQLHNYKSFLDSGPITLAPGFNILTGQNNAGKTALLEGSALNFSNKPHRSSATIPTPRHEPEGRSSARLRIKANWDDLDDFLKTTSDWSFQDVDAPKLLEDLFSALSEARLEYRKVEHSTAITEWLIRNKPEALQEIADLLASKLLELHPQIS